MLSKKTLRKSNQQDCKLLNLSVETMISIIKSYGLDPFDIACLMLTCKGFASLIINFNVEPKLKTRLRSGKEEEVLCMFRELTPTSDFFMHESDEPALDGSSDALVREFEQRTRPSGVLFFLQRLDKGWNQSKTRLCTRCQLFRPTKKSYWEKKVQSYLYKSDGLAAQGCRIMDDCQCECSPNEVLKRWIKHGKHKFTSALQCPDCVFSQTKVSGPACDRCCDISMDYAWEDCGCHRCGCHCCSHDGW